jgi:hypothetical protein
MDNSQIAQQLKTLALCGGGLVLASLAGWYIGSSNYIFIIFGFAIVAVICLALFSGPFFWVITIASSFLGGTFPILGGSFTPFQVLMAIGLVKFVVEDIVLRRKRFNFGNRQDLFLIAGFMAIITFHGVHDRFGMRFLGSSIWGGGNYVNVYVGLAAFFVTQSISMKPRLWAKLPYAILAVTGFDLVIAVITTIFPSLIYKIYPFYSAVSASAIQEILTGTAVDAARLGPFGNFGLALITLMLASVSLQRIMMPPLFFRMVSLAVGAAGVLLSSFRTNVFNAVAVFFVAGIRDLKFRILALVPLLAISLFFLSVLNSEFVRLPKQMQRSLSFLPGGQWDVEMQNDALASNEFRKEVWTTFGREYFPIHPWLGRGFGFRTEQAAPSMYHPGKAFDYHQMVEVGNMHNGFLACLDTFGIVGTIFFIIWNLRVLFRAFQISFKNTGPEEKGLRFLALYLGASIICYWMGAPNVGTFLPREFALVGVFLGLQAEGKRAARPVTLSSAGQPSVAPKSVALA